MEQEALLYEKTADNGVTCNLCAHRCSLADGHFGICGVRRNDSGTLKTLVYGDLIAAHVDPIEKKPLYHFLPGSTSYSIATIGCNFRCGFCQNWRISQTSKRDEPRTGKYVPPARVVVSAKENGCDSISFTYTEPTIYFEYALDTARLAKKAGLATVFVTNGFMSGEALDLLPGLLDAANIDLKGFSEHFYRTHCKARLQPVLDSIVAMHDRGIWVEVTTLVIPGENDSEKELGDIAKFLAGISPDIPWHVSRFHPDHRFTGYDVTPHETIRKATVIGREAGLKYVYPGNVLDDASTHCPSCGATVVERAGFRAGPKNLRDGVCSSCGAKIGGVWKQERVI